MQKGSMAEWVALTFMKFVERPLSYLDAAKVLYSEHVDNDPVTAKALARNAITSKKAGQILSKNALELRWQDTVSTGHREARVIAIPRSVYTYDEIAFEERHRPNDGELHELAIALRLGLDNLPHRD